AEAIVGARAPADAASPQHRSSVHEHVCTPNERSGPGGGVSPNDALPSNEISALRGGIKDRGGRHSRSIGQVVAGEGGGDIQIAGANRENVVVIAVGYADIFTIGAGYLDIAAALSSN